MMKTKEKTEKDLSRRKFIKTSAAGMGTALLAGLDVKNAAAQNTLPVDHWDKEADVVVVGYGGAGVVAAITAHDAGVKVIVLEKAPFRSGGNLGELCAFGRIAGRNAAAEVPWS